MNNYEITLVRLMYITRDQSLQQDVLTELKECRPVGKTIRITRDKVRQK
jgi:hypothetical protein